MSEILDAAEIYWQAAEICGERQEEQLRDRFLVLAADAAWARGRQKEAENLRLRLLSYNPHHLLQPYATLSEALASVDVRAYVDALRRSHPIDQAKHVLSAASPSPAGPAEISRYVVAHQRHPEPESAALYRISDSDGKRAEVKDPVLSASTVAGKQGWSRWRRIFFRKSKAGEAAFAAFSKDIYSIRREDRRENMGRRSVLPEAKRGPGIWIVLPLFMIVLAGGLVLTLSVMLRPFWT
jgi:hypothetical protein